MDVDEVEPLTVGTIDCYSPHPGDVIIFEPAKPLTVDYRRAIREDLEAAFDHNAKVVVIPPGAKITIVRPPADGELHADGRPLLSTAVSISPLARRYIDAEGRSFDVPEDYVGLCPFDEDATCRACGSTDVAVNFKAAAHDYSCRSHRPTGRDACCSFRHIHRHCRRCHKEWIEAPVDVTEKLRGLAL